MLELKKVMLPPHNRSRAYAAASLEITNALTGSCLPSLLNPEGLDNRR
ncbi:MAG: hypothetical protein ACLQDM_25465 [Bradyrhizobium sp.]